MPQYLSARTLVRTGRSEPPVYCLRHNAEDTARFGSKSIFLARSIDLTCASHLYGANSSGQCFARWISFYTPIFSDIDYGRYHRKFTTNQV